MFGSKDFKETYEEEKYKEKKLFKTIWQIISLRILPFFILRSTYDIKCTFLIGIEKTLLIKWYIFMRHYLYAIVFI